VDFSGTMATPLLASEDYSKKKLVKIPTNCDNASYAKLYLLTSISIRLGDKELR